VSRSADSETGFSKLLVAIEALADQGPLTLDQFSSATGFSRTSSFRLLKVLEARNWVRPEMGAGAYALTGSFMGRMRLAYKTYEEIDRLLPALKSIASSEDVHFDVAVLENLVSVRVVETTRRKRIPDCSDFFASPFVNVALCAASPRRRNMVLTAALDVATSDQKDEIQNGVLDARIRSIGAIGYGEDLPNLGIIIPLNGFNGFMGALRIASSRTNQPRMNIVRNVAEHLQSGEINLIPARISLQSVNS